MMHRLKADFILIIVALVWGFAFAAQRSAAPLVGIWWFNGIRFLLAGLVLLPLFFRRERSQNLGNNAGLIIITSLVLAAASGLQQAGLQYTSAANAGFITSLYVVLVPIIGLLLFRRRTRVSAWIAASVAMAGAMLLSIGGGKIQFMLGDILEFIGAILWAFHLILIDRIVKEVDVLVFAVIQYFIVGIVQSFLGLLFEPSSLLVLNEVWWAIAYTGIVSVGVGYTLQAVAQKYAPPVDAAIILSMESVFAALSGFWFLNEALKPVQVIGCIIIFSAVLLAQIPVYVVSMKQKQGSMS